ncbi:hypothetical protein DSLASN_26710 [Desulfoluna limicola]|uniref:Uncharacterized protein n=1 Tax=Desulfoluna limicola TaxID=2810562 RepID=A0ABM7PHI6_9BACT|nr:hypothetical protein DSLASN_26710 [Desulfoluna limicola]
MHFQEAGALETPYNAIAEIIHGMLCSLWRAQLYASPNDKFSGQTQSTHRTTDGSKGEGAGARSHLQENQTLGSDT